MITYASRITSIAVLAVALMTTPALAQSPTEGHHDHHDHALPSDELDDDTAFDHFVRGIDTLPNRDAVEERWPDAKERLVDLATDPDEATEYERWRATSLLGNFPDEDVREALVELTDDETRRVRSMAYYVLGAAFLEDGDDELFARLEAGLDDEKRQVGERIIQSFRWTDHEGAHELLEEIARDHADEDLQRVANHTLRHLE